MRAIILLSATLGACVPAPDPCVGDACAPQKMPEPMGPSEQEQDPPAPDAGGPPPTMSCASDDDCGAPIRVCESDICVPGCQERNAPRCTTGTVCDRSTGHCVHVSGPCATDADCGPPSSVCESNQCIPGCGEAGGLQCVGALT